MFTGLIEATGVVAALTAESSATCLEIDARDWAHRPQLGDSVSVNGCCLTIAAPHPTPGRLLFDVVPETLDKTTLGHFAPGTPVNLEHAATVTTLLGGHVVQGHVDGVATVQSVVESPEHRVRLAPPAHLAEFLTPKGSLTLDGVSLTIASLDPREGWFEVALIPTTLDKTTLRTLRPGSRVNLECDVMAKTIIHWLKHHASCTT